MNSPGKINSVAQQEKGSTMNDRTPEKDLGVEFHRGPVPFEQLVFSDECPTEADYQWAWENPDLRPLYEGSFVAVWQRTVWGAGKTPQAAWEDAQRKTDCPSISEMAFVPIVGMPLKGKPDRNQQL